MTSHSAAETRATATTTINRMWFILSARLPPSRCHDDDLHLAGMRGHRLHHGFAPAVPRARGGAAHEDLRDALLAGEIGDGERNLGRVHDVGLDAQVAREAEVPLDRIAVLGRSSHVDGQTIGM